MIINDLMRNANLTQYQLGKLSHVSQATLSDICSGKTSLEKCTAGTLYKIAKALHVTVDSLLEAESNKDASNAYKLSFETFKGNICHRVKDIGDIRFIIEVLESDQIQELYNRKDYPEALYLLGMLDYLSNQNSIPLCTKYDSLRNQKLSETLYPSGLLIQAAVMHDEGIKEEAKKIAIPEFMRFNIVESEVRNIA